MLTDSNEDSTLARIERRREERRACSSTIPLKTSYQSLCAHTCAHRDTNNTCTKNMLRVLGRPAADASLGLCDISLILKESKVKAAGILFLKCGLLTAAALTFCSTAEKASCFHSV